MLKIALQARGWGPKSTGSLTRDPALLGRLLRALHLGHLKITGSSPHYLIFLNQFDKDIRQERTLD